MVDCEPARLKFLVASRVALFWLASPLACSTATAAELDKRGYQRHADTMGVILLDVNWGRQWLCGGYENAQLMSLGFERVPVEEGASEHASFELTTPSRAFAKSEFRNHGFLVEPGTYAFSSWSLKVARSVRDVGYLGRSRADMITGDNYLGGTVEVAAGEVIYIGNFFLDCLEQPIPWRYYTEGEAERAAHMAEYQRRFRFLRGQSIEFRLLDTDSYGTAAED